MVTGNSKEKKMNIKPDIFYQDKSFDITFPEKYTLSIRLGSDGFSFLLLDVSQHKYVVFLNYNIVNLWFDETRFTAIWKVIFNTHQWLNKSFKSTHIFIENQYSTLIPGVLYNANQMSEYLRFNMGEIPYEMKYDAAPIKQISAYQVFSYPAFCEKLWQETLAQYKALHFSIPMIESLLIKNKHKILDKKVFLHVRKKHIDIIILEKEGLLFYNTFEYTTQEDLLYYLLYVFENQKLNTEEIPLMITGDIEKQSTVFDLIKTYIRHVSLGEDAALCGFYE